MPALVLDSGAVTRFAGQSRGQAALLLAMRDAGAWPPVVPSVVLVESLQGHAGRDASTNRFLKTCRIVEDVSEGVARRGAHLRARARRGSAVDAIVIALAEPDGTVFTSDPRDLNALADQAAGVTVLTV